MAQDFIEDTKVSNAPLNTNTKLDFEKAKNALYKLTDVKRSYHKNISTFDKSRLLTFLQNIGTNEKNLRNLSWYMFYRSSIYRRIILYNAVMFQLDARRIVPHYDLAGTNDNNKILKDFYETAKMLDNMNLMGEFFKVFITCFTQDVFYGIAYYEDAGLYIMPLPPDYCKIMGRYSTGDFGFALDMTYFVGSNNYLLEYWGEPFVSMYRQYEADRINYRWQPVPDKYAVCLKYGIEDWQVIVPPFSGLLNDVISLEDTKNVQAIADEQDIYKMIYLQMETLGKTVDDWKVDPELLIEYFNRMLEEAIPEYTTAAIVPAKLDTVSFDDNKTADINKVSNATKNVLNNSGGAQLLNSASITGTTGLLAAIKLDSRMAISSLLPQVEGWLNRFLSYYLTNPCKVKFFNVTYFTKDDLKETLLKDAQYSLPTKLAVNILNGYSELETMAMNYFEEDVLGLNEKFIYPLKSSHTATANENVGRPASDPEDLTDDGEKSRIKSDRA